MCLLLALALLSPLGSASAAGAELNGRAIAGARLDGWTTMLPLRAVGEALGLSVGWEQSTRTATLSGGGVSLSAGEGESYLVANGRYIYLGAAARTVGGRLYLPARPLAKALGLSVEWEQSTKTARLYGAASALESGASFYKPDEVEWLARIISAEARGESLAGQIAVGQVVLNRVRSAEFPDTIYGVIFDRQNGVQFEPTQNGEIWREPTAEAVVAAKLALDGADVVGGSLYFLNPATAASGWIARNRAYFATIGNHRFYL